MSVTLLLHLLHTYNASLPPPTAQLAVNFGPTEALLGSLMARLGDACGGVRCAACGCVIAVLRVAARLVGYLKPFILHNLIVNITIYTHQSISLNN